MSSLCVSDVHLSPERPEITRAFLCFLKQQAKGAEQLYILGDLFETWVGDDAMDQTFHQPIVDALRAYSDSGKELYLIHGNRDFMIDQTFLNAAGACLLADPEPVMLEGRRVVLSHGDLLCTDDAGYQRFRKLLRNRLSLNLLKKLPRSARDKISGNLRSQSQTTNQYKSRELMDVNEQAVQAVLREHGAELLVHGHTHRPGRHPVKLEDKQCERIVLGDWDKQLWYLEIEPQQLSLIPLPIAETDDSHSPLPCESVK